MQNARVFSNRRTTGSSASPMRTCTMTSSLSRTRSSPRWANHGEHLLPACGEKRLSCGSSVLWLPWSFVSQDCVEDRQEFASDGDERNLLGLASCDEPIAAGLEERVVSRRDHGADEENGSHAAAAAADEASAFPLTGLARPWRKAGKGGDGAAIERAEFRQF